MGLGDRAAASMSSAITSSGEPQKYGLPHDEVEAFATPEGLRTFGSAD